MRNYYVELDIEPSESAAIISDQLVSLRKKWVQRSNMAATPEARSEAELKVALIREALRVFADEESRRQYDVELNNQPEDVVKKPNDSVDAVYEKKLARVNEYFEEKDYKTASDRAKDMLAEGYKTAEVYELVMLSLYNLGSQYDDQIQSFGDAAIDADGITDSRVYRVYVFATERKNNYSLAHRRLIELKRVRPNDTSVDYLIANMFMNHFRGQFLAEARDYIDELIRSKKYDNSTEVAEWDVRCELRQHHIQMAIPKIAKYLTDKQYSDAAFKRDSLVSLTKLLEEYALSNYDNVTAYISKLDETLVDDNIACGKSIPAWDMLYTLEISKDLTKDWYSLAEKYDAQTISSASYEIMKRYAARCVHALPSYAKAVSAGAATLSVSNNSDYSKVSKQLETLNNIRKKALVSDGSIDDMIAEIDAMRNYARYKLRLKPLVTVRLFTRTYWCVFIIPLLALLTVTLVNQFTSSAYLQEISQIIQVIEPFKPLVIAGCYLVLLWIVLLGLVTATMQRRQNQGRKVGFLVFVCLLLFAAPYGVASLSGLISENTKNGNFTEFIESNKDGLGFLSSIYDKCYELVSSQPMISGAVALAVFIFGCVISSKIKKLRKSINSIKFASTLMSWIR